MNVGDIVRILPKGDEYDHQTAEVLEVADNWCVLVIFHEDGTVGDFPFADLEVLPPLFQLASMAD